MAAIRHGKICQYIERQSCRQAIQLIYESKERQEFTEKVCETIFAISVWFKYEGNQQFSWVTLIEELSKRMLVLCFTQQFHPSQLGRVKYTIISKRPLLLHFHSVSAGDRAEDMPVLMKILWTD